MTMDEIYKKVSSVDFSESSLEELCSNLFLIENVAKIIDVKVEKLKSMIKDEVQKQGFGSYENNGCRVTYITPMPNLKEVLNFDIVPDKVLNTLREKGMIETIDTAKSPYYKIDVAKDESIVTL